MFEFEGAKIEWMGHATFRITGNNMVVYFDPFKIHTEKKADLILITHEHFDHCSVEDVMKVVKDDTVIVCPFDCAAKLKETGAEIKTISVGDDLKIKGMNIYAVPAYNMDKDFHPKDNGWLGYILYIASTSIYHAGDTDKIPEMKELEDIQVALLPVSGTYVMNANEAAEACTDIGPKIAIPMHYGEIVGTSEDAKMFSKKCEAEVHILDRSLE